VIHSGQVRYHENLEVLFDDIDAVTQHPENPNNGDVEEVIESIEINGMYNAIKAQRSTGHIVAGNTTWEACKLMGAKTIPIVWLDIDDTEARRIVLVDNRAAQLARMDPALELEMLDRLVRTSNGDMRALLGTGYDERSLERATKIAEMPMNLDVTPNWPTLSIQLPPKLIAAFREITDEADTDRDRFELLLRMAGWET
jgi:hypothetical protein